MAEVYCIKKSTAVHFTYTHCLRATYWHNFLFHDFCFLFVFH